MRAARCAMLIVVWALTGLSAYGADDAEETAPRLTWSGQVNAIGYSLSNAYFGGADAQPREGADPDYLWLESIARLGVGFQLTERISLNAGVAGIVTLDEDPFGLDDATTGIVEVANVAITDLGLPGLDLTVGRQDIKIGDGFLVQDGYADTRVAVWSVPLKFWDAVRLDYRRGAFAGTAMVARLSSSFGHDGELYGVDLAWLPGAGKAGKAAVTPAAPVNAELSVEAEGESEDEADDESEEAAEEDEEEAPTTYLGLGWFEKSDDGEADENTRIVALRGSLPLGPVTLAGEVAQQSGERLGEAVDADAWHADVRWDLPYGRSPYLFASYLHYSGDDPATADDESFSWPHYSADDWSHYYLGELVGSTLFFNNDQNVLKLEAGLQLAEPLELRLFYLDISADTGAWYGVPEGAGDALATEWDAVVTWTATERLTTWLLVGYATPGAASEAVFGDEASTLLELGASWTF